MFFSCSLPQARFDEECVWHSPFAARWAMRSRLVAWTGLLLALQAVGAGAANAGGIRGARGELQAHEKAATNSSTRLLPFRRSEPMAKDLPLDQLAAKHRDMVKHVLVKPAFSARGPSETFFCKPEHYRWLLDHPDRAVKAWRRLGAKCVAITCQGDQLFGWADDQGSEVAWEAVHRGAELRIWYAEGKVRPGPLMPLVPVKALVVIRHKELKDENGAAMVQHQADLFVQTDSKTATMVARMLGPTSHRVAEQGLGQLQLFFSGLSWYLDRHPEHEDVLLRASD